MKGRLRAASGGNPLAPLAGMVDEVAERTDRAAATAAITLERAIKIMLSHPGTGRWYRSRGTKKVWHRASAPGQPPAPDTGTLRRSPATERVRLGRYRVGTNIEYASGLEFGHDNVKPRPFMRPALKTVRDFLRRLGVDALTLRRTRGV